MNSRCEYTKYWLHLIAFLRDFCDVYVGGKVRVSEFMIFLALQQCGSK